MRPGHDRHLRAIVFSDVVDSSAKIFADELIAVQQIKDDLALIKEQLQRHGGSLVKSLGDGLLMTFDAPSHALDFIQDVILRLTAREQRSLAHRFGLQVRSMPMVMTFWAKGCIWPLACKPSVLSTVWRLCAPPVS